MKPTPDAERYCDYCAPDERCPNGECMGDDVSEPTLTDAAVQAIVDDHAPSQGESWDMAAMLREAYAAGLAAGAAQQRETDADALHACQYALTDWLHTYAADQCAPERVKTAHERIFNSGGTLAYIARTQALVAAAISAQQEAKG